jgi:hypothetical protein
VIDHISALGSTRARMAAAVGAGFTLFYVREPAICNLLQTIE